jgi:ABC-type Fe3+-hydroxamate transport system substrate-binding protein
MDGNTARLALLLAFALALAACSSEVKEPEANVFPANYKQEILDTLAKTLDVPTGTREAFITDPALIPVNKDSRYIVCVRANARNVDNTYSGSKDRIAYFYGGHLNQVVMADQGQCAKAAYKPFPELEKLCYANKCN